MVTEEVQYRTNSHSRTGRSRGFLEESSLEFGLKPRNEKGQYGLGVLFWQKKGMMMKQEYTLHV